MNGPESAEEAARRFQEPTLAQCVEQIRDRGKVGLPFSRVVLIVSEVAEALSALHAKGRTCGHVQASRITVPAHGPAQLLDTAAADAPAADAPAAGVGGDVVGLASAAYYALCGVLPSYFHTMSSLSDGLPADGPASFPVSPSLYRPELTPEVCDVFTRGLSRRSRDRYTSADEFATALRNSAGPAPAAMSARLPSKRILAAVAALVTLALLITGVWLGHARQSQSPPPVTASAPDQPLSSPASPKAAPEQKPPQIRVAAPAVSPPRAAVAAQPSQTAAAKIPASVAALPAPITPKAADIPSSASRSAAPAAGHKDTAAKAAVRPKPTPGRAYLRVYARQFVSISDVLEHRLRSVPAHRVSVDGKPSQALASGRWALIAPGKHKLAFYPVTGIPFDPNTTFWVQITPHHRHAFQIPLPRHPGGFQGADRKKSPLEPV